MLKLRQRLQREEGFTLIELLVVIVIIGILLAIAIPSYLGFRDRANKADALANLRQAVPAAEGYYSDNQTYVLMDKPALTGYDSGLSADILALKPADQTATNYCIAATHGAFTFHYSGPGGAFPTSAVVNGDCP